MALPPPRLFDPLVDKRLLPQIAQIHADCILNDNQLATFLPPLDLTKMTNYWLDLSERVEKGEVAIVLQMAPTVITTADDDDDGGEGDWVDEGGQAEGEVAGYVSLVMNWSETGPFRGHVNKLMVSPKYRRMGIARRVMTKLEEAAREKRRELLILDTTIGTEADKVYPKLGFKEWGVLPKYGISPHDGKTLVDERFYYKDLRDTT